MLDFAQKLTKLRVSGIDLTQGDAGLFFENGACLSIYNSFYLKNINEEEKGKIVGSYIKNVEQLEKLIILHLENNVDIIIKMDNDAYNGPEAMQLTSPNAPTIIWN